MSRQKHPRGTSSRAERPPASTSRARVPATPRADDTRQRILDAAEVELRTASLSATRVATRAGVSRQAVYYHFGRLGELRAALAERGHAVPDEPEGTPRQRIVEAAVRVMSRPDGRDSFDAVADEAGVTRGALYHHFGDKRSLLIAVAERVIPSDAFPAELARSEGQPDRDRLVGLLRVYEAELLARGEVIRGLMTRARSEPLLAEVLAGEIIGRVGSVLFPWFQERMTAGVFRPVHPALALQLLITPIALRVIGEPMFLAVRSVGVPTAADDLESWVDLILAGLGTDRSATLDPGV